MNINFISFGGIAGLFKNYKCNSENLPASVRNLIDILVIDKEKYKYNLSKFESDEATCFILQLISDNNVINFHFNEAHMPLEIEPLIYYLLKKSLD